MSSSETKGAIRDELLCLLQNKPIDMVKVTELTDCVGINRVTFYRHYESVYDALQEIEDLYLEGLAKLAEKTARVPFDDRFFNEPEPLNLACAKYFLVHRKVVLTLFGPYGDESFQWRCAQMVRKYLISPAMTQHYIKEGNEAIQEFLVSGYVSMAVQWLKQEKRMSAEEFTVLTYRMIFGFYRHWHHQ